jgi:hypothetical protein
MISALVGVIAGSAVAISSLNIRHANEVLEMKNGRHSTEAGSKASYPGGRH